MANKHLHFFMIAFILLVSSACASTPQPTPATTRTPTQPVPTRTAVVTHSCTPTLDDDVSPSYMPGTPERTVVGSGHIVTGIVLSSTDCQPIANAKLEFWPEEAGLGHPDSSRATFFTDENGFYRFECNQPEHIHMRISAPGYKTIGVNSYHPEGKTEGVFDFVLSPE